MAAVTTTMATTEERRTPQEQATTREGGAVGGTGSGDGSGTDQYTGQQASTSSLMRALEAVYHDHQTAIHGASGAGLSLTTPLGPPTTTSTSLTPPASSGSNAVISTMLTPSTHAIEGATPTTTTLDLATPTSVGSESTGTSQAGATPQAPALDPTFLAALPDSIRQEVMAQHEREQRLLRAQREASFVSTISPEFLAALPPNIQEEVMSIKPSANPSILLYILVY